jgi:hypothetical protein
MVCPLYHSSRPLTSSAKILQCAEISSRQDRRDAPYISHERTAMTIDYEIATRDKSTTLLGQGLAGQGWWLAMNQSPGHKLDQ